MIPILIICYNNHLYVNNTIQQLKKINSDLLKNIIIINNNSTNVETLQYLDKVDVKIIHNERNNGPWIAPHCNSHIYNTMPNQFILTDPDLEFNKDLPLNFIDTLIELSNRYNCEKIGMALDISEPDKLFNISVGDNIPLIDHELLFWKDKIPNDTYELYNASIDTTFCLVKKDGIYNYKIRIAGNYTAKHLPWYYENSVINIYDIYRTYIETDNYTSSNGTAKISTISGFIIPYITTKYSKIQKLNEVFFIKNRPDDPNMNFWRDVYGHWENDTFEIFDQFLKRDKVFIDIGGWVGTTCMYGARKSKHVYVVEADHESFQDLITNCKTNAYNITCIQNAILNESNKNISFGKNKFLINSKLNDSTSQIYIDSEGAYTVKTITVNDILVNYSIDPSTVSLIKVDIEGGEEMILQDLYNIHRIHSIPLYISFHYSWWSDKNLDRFDFLTNEQKTQILRWPFVSLLFS